MRRTRLVATIVGLVICAVLLAKKVLNRQLLNRQLWRHSATGDEAQAADEALARPSIAAEWALPGDEPKKGSGLLLFAYGGARQVDAFLGEATLAAAAFRKHNPQLPIAIVTNNETEPSSHTTSYRGTTCCFRARRARTHAGPTTCRASGRRGYSTWLFRPLRSRGRSTRMCTRSTLTSSPLASTASSLH